MNFRLFRESSAQNTPKSKRLQKHEQTNLWLVGVLTVLLSATLIIYFMPRSSSFNYDYRLNQPWRYGALFASQKFNIQMSDSAIQAQQDSVRQHFQPYFYSRSTVQPAMRARLLSMEVKADDESDKKVQAVKDPQMRRYVLHIAQLLDTVYAHGVIAPAVYDSLAATNVATVRIIRNNVATPTDFSSLFSTHTAYLYIMNYDKEHFDPSVLSKLNINMVLEENAIYDAEKSEEECEAVISSLSTGVGFVMANEKIVDRGDIVTPETYLKLKSYEEVVKDQNTENEKLPFIIIGQSVMVVFVLIALMSYLQLFRRDYLTEVRGAILLFALVTVFCILASLMVSHHFFHIFVLPCCMVPIFIRVFLDSRTAYIFHTALVLLISLILTYPYEFIILQLATGMVAIQNLRELSQRSQIIKTAFIITLSYILFYIAYELTLGVAIEDVDRSTLVYFGINGILLLFAYPMLWMFEKAFGFISDVTLIELTNINTPLLQRMTEVAPGTFQHSMQVANLASEVAKKVGAKPQLVRTGALYHDIGKMERPVFFTENQSGANPHKHLTPVKSAEVIIRHVTRGLELAGQHNIPNVIKRFIATHHGTGKVKFFYITYKNEHPDESFDESIFSYPGPNPSSKEEAILMMCDGVEAASRSLPEYTEESISTLVDRIIDSQVSEGYFTECDITFRDIAIAKSILKDRLKNIYHTRVTYPELINTPADATPA